jgi:hypothetical protein
MRDDIDWRIAQLLASDGYDGLTWGEWLRAAFTALLADGEGFSGKRPVGDSGWERFLARSLKARDVSMDDLVDYLFRPRPEQADPQ